MSLTDAETSCLCELVQAQRNVKKNVLVMQKANWLYADSRNQIEVPLLGFSG
jgi:hypothetical protein